METFKDFLEESSKEPLKDSKGNDLQHGDKLHNPHTGDVATYDAKKKKLEYPDGSKMDAKRAGVSDWWHKIDAAEHEKKAEENIKADKDREELSKHIKRLMK